jgi:hypothetical protein
LVLNAQTTNTATQQARAEYVRQLINLIERLRAIVAQLLSQTATYDNPAEVKAGLPAGILDRQVSSFSSVDNLTASLGTDARTSDLRSLLSAFRQTGGTIAHLSASYSTVEDMINHLTSVAKLSDLRELLNIIRALGGTVPHLIENYSTFRGFLDTIKADLSGERTRQLIDTLTNLYTLGVRWPDINDGPAPTITTPGTDTSGSSSPSGSNKFKFKDLIEIFMKFATGQAGGGQAGQAGQNNLGGLGSLLGLLGGQGANWGGQGGLNSGFGGLGNLLGSLGGQNMGNLVRGLASGQNMGSACAGGACPAGAGPQQVQQWAQHGQQLAQNPNYQVNPNEINFTGKIERKQQCDCNIQPQYLIVLKDVPTGFPTKLIFDAHQTKAVGGTGTDASSAGGGSLTTIPHTELEPPKPTIGTADTSLTQCYYKRPGGNCDNPQVEQGHLMKVVTVGQAAPTNPPANPTPEPPNPPEPTKSTGYLHKPSQWNCGACTVQKNQLIGQGYNVIEVPLTDAEGAQLGVTSWPTILNHSLK